MQDFQEMALKVRSAIEKHVKESVHLNCAKCKKLRSFEIKTITFDEKGEVTIDPRFLDLDWINFYVTEPCRYGTVCPSCAVEFK